MHSKLLLALSLAALASAQTTATGTLPAVPSTTAGIPTIEGALTYDGPPVEGYTGPGGNATVQSGLPQASFMATLPTTMFDPNTGTLISGTVMASTAPGGTGVMFTISWSGFPSVAEYGPFVYHIHELAVPANGNCTATMGHLDPTDRGELHSCEVAAPQTCQAGDLAGKHGNVTAASWSVSYTDMFLSTDPSSMYYFGDKSVVIHSSNATRLTCANFVSMAAVANGTATSTGTGTGAATSSSTGSPAAPIATVTSAAAPALASAGVVAAVVAAVAALLL